MTPISGKTVKAISCGSYHTIVLMDDGSVYGTGSNSFGELGNGFTIQKTTLTAMTPISGKTVKAIACGGFHTIVLMTDGSVYGTGNNSNGQLGNETNDNKTTLTAMTPISGKTVTAISCGNYHTIVLMTDGTVYGTGNNSNGQLGNGFTTQQTKLTAMTIGNGSTPVTYVNNIFESDYIISLFVNLNNQSISFDSSYNGNLNIRYTNDISGTYTILDASANLDLSVNTIFYRNIASPFDVPFLNVKDNSLNFLLTSNGSTQKYFVSLHVKNNDVTLKQFVVSGIPVSDGSIVNLPFGTGSVSVVATPTDASASWVISGNTNLKTGDNSLNVSVTAEDPSYNNIYRVNLHVKNNDVTLKQFDVSGIPVSDGSNVNLPFGTGSVSVVAIPTDASANRDISGNTNLKTGDNSLNVKVTAEDPSYNNIYRVNLRVDPVSRFIEFIGNKTSFL